MNTQIQTPQSSPLPVANSFARTMSELRKGQANSEASNALAEVVKAVNQHRKPGEVTLKLKIRPGADGESLSIEDHIDVKLPRKDRKSTTFFATEDGALVKDDPRQKEMFTAIDGGQAEEPAIAPMTPPIAINQ